MGQTYVNTPLGMLSLFDDGGAVVALEWGRVPDRHITPLLERACTQVEAFFAGTLTLFDLPLRPDGTPFQRAVWNALLSIPYGTTTTYGRFAHGLGTGPRAVAAACARNPIPIIVPCHRVIGAGVRLGGYSSGDGLATKKALLRLEGALASDLWQHLNTRPIGEPA